MNKRLVKNNQAYDNIGHGVETYTFQTKLYWGGGH